MTNRMYTENSRCAGKIQFHLHSVCPKSNPHKWYYSFQGAGRGGGRGGNEFPSVSQSKNRLFLLAKIALTEDKSKELTFPVTLAMASSIRRCMVRSQAFLQNAVEVACKNQASTSCFLCPDTEPLSTVLKSQLEQELHSPPFYLRSPIRLLRGHCNIPVLPIFSLTCQPAPLHLRLQFQCCAHQWDCKCHPPSKSICVAQSKIHESVQVLPIADPGKGKPDTLQSTRLWSYGKNGCQWSQLSLSSSTQLISTAQI